MITCSKPGNTKLLPRYCVWILPCAN